MSDESDDGVDYFDRLESVPFPKQHPEETREDEKGSPRSPIFAFLGDKGVGKSQLISCIGGQRIIGNRKPKFDVGVCFVKKSQVETIAQSLGIEGKLASPGVLLIESPIDARWRWSRVVDMADIVVLVVDASAGLESSIYGILAYIKKKHKPLVLVLNKVEELSIVQRQIEMDKIMKQLEAQGLVEFPNRVSLSALRGDGLPAFLDMLLHLTEILDSTALTLGRTVQCKVVSVKDVVGHGILMLAVVVDGVLHASDTVVLSSVDPLVPIVSAIKALWTPHHSGDLLVAEGPYDQEEKIPAGQGVIVALKETEAYPLDMNLRVLGPNDDVTDLKGQAMRETLEILCQMNM